MNFVYINFKIKSAILRTNCFVKIIVLVGLILFLVVLHKELFSLFFLIDHVNTIILINSLFMLIYNLIIK